MVETTICCNCMIHKSVKKKSPWNRNPSKTIIRICRSVGLFTPLLLGVLASKIGLILQATPFFNDEHHEAKKQPKKRTKWEPTRNSWMCSTHFNDDNFICHFSFTDKVTKKPILPRLKWENIGITAVPSIHAKALTKQPFVTESAKCCLKRAVRNLCQFNVSIHFKLIYFNAKEKLLK